MKLPCGDTYDFTKSVWCKKLAEKNFNTQDFDCTQYSACMGMVDEALCNCLSHKSKYSAKVQEPVQEALINGLEVKPVEEFVEVE